MDHKEKYEKLQKQIDQLQKKIFQSSIKDVELIQQLEHAQQELKNLNNLKENKITSRS